MDNHEQNQAAFSKVVRHLLKQGRASMVGNQCLYRGPAGLQCAIGCLLTDAEYKEDMDRCFYGVTDLLRHFNVPSLAGLDGRLLSMLQGVHDCEDHSDWRARLSELARSFGLSMPDVEAPHV